MISNQILQTTIEGLKVISRIDLGVIDLEGNVLATTFPEAAQNGAAIAAFVDSPADSQVVQEYQFLKFLMRADWSMCCWPKAAVMTYIW